MSNCGISALLGGGNSIPQCQMLGLTNGNQYFNGAFVTPASVPVSLYIFGRPTTAFNAAMTALQNTPGNANNVVQLVGPVALAQVPAQVGTEGVCKQSLH